MDFDEVENDEFFKGKKFDLKKKLHFFFMKVDKCYMKMKREEDDNKSYHML